ncbi:hypothetical protein A2950_01405 [Candidatus Kaiserbacteria bacterium RIFCSPLOWO2_01_FULL_55_19]|uniref:Uncharacterized protein n=1 Tax=Candidatus Kaiserbacteria bacterium RIFCSPLOWO2_01_FULL_55_19 TaxID=1798516 RepID=A0A1F6ERN2_9BACT|nr:MAG: hypothetical protein A2950_01405 [Candidatus Kaiserbacteria bacterium RIFCSPLOWO2_01_FULL_55_19]
MATATTREEVARRVHSMTTSGISFDLFGKVHTYELFGHAAAGVALLHKVPLKEAEEMLLKGAG